MQQPELECGGSEPGPALASGSALRCRSHGGSSCNEYAMRLTELLCIARRWQAIFLLLATLFVAVAAPSAVAAEKRASMVIDANTGKTLHASRADELRHPASLTKIMTLYLVFEEIEQGRLSLDSKIRMTKWGAMAPPSKLGLKEGETISVRDAIRALVTKSANDVARAVAEHIGGTEVNFAKMMTEKARLLGMSKTTFRNASGLPDPEQVTTARDMLTLALHLQDHFPQHYHFFSTRVFNFKGRSYRNHNGLLRTYAGTDGIKTGYIRMSGFNVVTSVRRGGRHVVGVVFGGKTAASRNAEMRALLDRALGKASTKKTRQPVAVSFYRATPPKPAQRPARATQVAASPTPRPIKVSDTIPAEPQHPTTPAKATDAASSTPKITVAKVRPVSITPVGGSQPEQAARTEPRSPSDPVIARTNSASTTGVVLGRPPSTLQEQAARLSQGQPALAGFGFMSQAHAMPAPPPSAQRAAPPPAREHSQSQSSEAPPRIPDAGGYHVQVGAYTSLAEAEKALVATLEQAPTVLAEAAPRTIPVVSGSRQLYRARFVGLDSSAARNACEELRRRKIDCFVAKAE